MKIPISPKYELVIRIEPRTTPPDCEILIETELTDEQRKVIAYYNRPDIGAFKRKLASWHID